MNTYNPVASANTLIEATDREPSAVERRKTGRKGIWSSLTDRRRRARANVGIEISPHQISLAILRETENGRYILTTDIAEIGCSSCNEWSVDKLTKLLKDLVAKHDIQGQSVYVALGGNACVTRSFYGNNEDVDASCKELSERASHYLALGRGEKVCSQAETAIDARRKRAWVTVAQREVLELVLRTIEVAGLRLGRVEHTLTALCQVAHEQGCDSQEPLLMVLSTAGRSDMFISFKGKLLLDYRPSTKSSPDTCCVNPWPALVVKHIKCLRRYLGSQLPKGQANLSKICLPATQWNENSVISEQLTANDLSFAYLNQEVAEIDLGSANVPECPEMMAAIWMARSMAHHAKLDSAVSQVASPGDLTLSIRRQFDWTIRTITSNFWPIAASLIILCGLYATKVQHQTMLGVAEAQLDDLTTVRLEYDRLQQQIQNAGDALKVVTQLKSKLPTATPDAAVKLLGRTLPKGTWLKQVDIDVQRNIKVVGQSFSEDHIYEYIGQLKETGVMHSIGLISSRPVRLTSGPAFEFELKAALSATANTIPTPETAFTIKDAVR